MTHAGPTSRYGTPSIAAVVANVDDSFVQFPASMRIQAVDEDKEAKEVRFAVLCFFFRISSRRFFFLDGDGFG